jgi:hypothetical protein
VVGSIRSNRMEVEDRVMRKMTSDEETESKEAEEKVVPSTAVKLFQVIDVEVEEEVNARVARIRSQRSASVVAGQAVEAIGSKRSSFFSMNNSRGLP